MREVSRPIIAITLVLCAVFVPVAFVPGLTGEFYRQFALTIAISTVISAFNSLTLSPALAALLLKPHGAKKDGLTRLMDKVLGRFFARFNRGFERAGNAYSRSTTSIVRRTGIALVVYAGLITLTYFGFSSVPGGFIPEQDKQYIIAIAQLPPAATLDRTEEVIRKIGEIGVKQPGVEHAVQFSGMSVNGFTPSSSAGIVFFALDNFDKRTTKETSAKAIAAALNQKTRNCRRSRTHSWSSCRPRLSSVWVPSAASSCRSKIGLTLVRRLCTPRPRRPSRRPIRILRW
jgi:multidrug efflux pump subunit AcrB